MHGAEELPLTGTCLLAPSHEPITAPDVLDLHEHGFDHPATCLVQATPSLRQQRSVHRLPHGDALGDPPSQGWLLALGLPLFPVIFHGDQQLGSIRYRRRQVGLTAYPTLANAVPMVRGWSFDAAEHPLHHRIVPTTAELRVIDHTGSISGLHRLQGGSSPYEKGLRGSFGKDRAWPDSEGRGGCWQINGEGGASF